MSVVVGDALQGLAGAGNDDGGERPAAGKTSNETGLAAVPGSLPHDEGIEDELLVESLTAVLLAEVEAVFRGDGTGGLVVGTEAERFGVGFAIAMNLRGKFTSRCENESDWAFQVLHGTLVFDVSEHR